VAASARTDPAARTATRLPPLPAALPDTAGGVLVAPCGLARPAHVAPARGAAMKRKARGRRTWRQDPAGRRAAILDAATCTFAAEGYRRARVEDIARQAGVAEGTVYHLFASKQGLLRAVGDAYGEGLVRAAFGDGPVEVQQGQAVAAMVERIFRHVAESGGPLVAFLLSNDPDEGGPAQAANRERMLAAIEDAMRRAIRAGRVSLRDTRVAAELQFCLVESALRDCFLRAGGERQGAYVQEVARALNAYLAT
jgi:AcrR family transcriptional regulator